MRLVENLQAGEHQFGAHHHREEAADHAGHHCEDKVHRADVLMVGGIDVAAPAGGMVSVLAVMVVFVGVEGGGHGDISYFDATRVAPFSSAANSALDLASQAAYSASVTTCSSIGI